MFQKHDLLLKATQDFVTSVSGNDGLAEDILTRVVIDCIRRYQEKVGAGIQDSVSDLLSNFKLKIAQEIFDIAQTWTIASKREMTLFPVGCRFLYTIGRSTIAVIEQSAGPRSLSLDNALLAAGYDENEYIYQRHLLSLPYSVFILHFHNDSPGGKGSEKISNLYYTWRTEPLVSITDRLYRPYLPNLHQNLAVCRGSSTQNNRPEAQTWDGGLINRISNQVISDFWNSHFNIDLSDMWWEKAAVPQIATVEDWVQNTRDNPLFILGVPMREYMTLGSLLNTLVSAAEENEPDASALRHRLADSIDNLSTEVFDKVVIYLKRTKFDRYYPKDVTKDISSALEPVAKQIRTLAAAIEMELNRLAKEAEQNRHENHGWERRGIYWSN